MALFTMKLLTTEHMATPEGGGGWNGNPRPRARAYIPLFAVPKEEGCSTSQTSTRPLVQLLRRFGVGSHATDKRPSPEFDGDGMTCTLQPLDRHRHQLVNNCMRGQSV